MNLAPFGAAAVAAQVTRERALLAMRAVYAETDEAEELRQWTAAADIAARYAHPYITTESIYRAQRVEPAMRGEEPRDLIKAAMAYHGADLREVVRDGAFS